MTGYVERGVIPGIVTLVGRGGATHVDAIGTKTVHGKEPMRRDTIFRIASITKPIAAAATMILVDDGKLRLDDAVERWLPGDGGFGTSAYADPKNDFIGILMTQRLMDSPDPPAVFDDFWSHAYRSLA
jgi:CubicO group peptidase (beta-lactamase class C family)